MSFLSPILRNRSYKYLIVYFALSPKGRYDQAVEYFNKSYNIARAMNDTETISSSRVLFGVAAAHKMLEAVTKHINVGSRPCVDRLIEWKDNRGDEFEKAIPPPGM